MFSRHLNIIRRTLIQVKNVEQFLKASKQNKAHIIQFTASWCGPCKQLTPILNKKQQTSNGEWKIIKVDVDQQGNVELCQKYGLEGVPTLIFVKDGKQVKKMVGSRGSKQLDEAIALLK